MDDNPLLSEEEQGYIIALGRDAETLKMSDTFKTICDTLYTNLFTQWTMASEPETREEIHATLRGIQAVQDTIDAVIGHGKVEADKRRDELERFKQSFDK